MLLFVTADDLKRDLGQITLKIVKGNAGNKKRDLETRSLGSRDDRIRTDDLFNVTEAL